jgi:hypothetical protein
MWNPIRQIIKHVDSLGASANCFRIAGIISVLCSKLGVCKVLPFFVLLGGGWPLGSRASGLHIRLPRGGSGGKVVQKGYCCLVVICHNSWRGSSSSLLQNFEHKCRWFRTLSQGSQYCPKVRGCHHFSFQRARLLDAKRKALQHKIRILPQSLLWQSRDRVKQKWNIDKVMILIWLASSSKAFARKLT